MKPVDNDKSLALNNLNVLSRIHEGTLQRTMGFDQMLTKQRSENRCKSWRRRNFKLV